VKISYTDEMRRLLKVCGVPAGLVFNFNIKWEENIRSYTEESKDDGKPACSFSMNEQRDTIKSLANLDVAKPKVIILSATDELTNLRRFVVPWFYNVVDNCRSNPKQSLGNMPRWHYIDFSFTDELLDDLKGKNNKEAYVDYKPLLVLDGVSTDSSSNKVEKLRDILNLSLDHTVIVILGGNTPYSFCKDRLGFKPNHFAVFTTPSRSRTVL
jgi:hypothetical protein